MTITLTPDQDKWLEAQVSAGRYATIDEAARAIIADRMAIEVEDLSWMKQELDTARAAVAHGHTETFENVQSRLAERINRLRQAT